MIAHAGLRFVLKSEVEPSQSYIWEQVRYEKENRKILHIKIVQSRTDRVLEWEDFEKEMPNLYEMLLSKGKQHLLEYILEIGYLRDSYLLEQFNEEELKELYFDYYTWTVSHLYEGLKRDILMNHNRNIIRFLTGLEIKVLLEQHDDFVRLKVQKEELIHLRSMNLRRFLRTWKNENMEKTV